MNYKLLGPIRDNPDEYEGIEESISVVLDRFIYAPLLKLAGMPSSTLQNSSDPTALIDAIQKGRIVHTQGEFRGRFNAAISKELMKLGAKWDRHKDRWKIELKKLPFEVQSAIRLSDDKFKRVLKTIDNKLADIVPEDIAEALSLEDQFDSSIFKMEKNIHDTIKSISVPAKLTPERVRTISTEYTNNVKLDIKQWAFDEVKELRKKVQESAFKGNRYENLEKMIKRSHGVSRAKAKFLARQETNLLLAKYTKSRMLEAGLPEYQWKCVHASPNHPVRPMHKALDGKTFRWDDPPIVNAKGERKNPGEDYNCRCYARPVVRF